MTNLNHGILKKMPVALPSTEEQYRIVQKVDELMALCDQLKERLNRASETRCQLAAAVVEAQQRRVRTFGRRGRRGPCPTPRCA